MSDGVSLPVRSGWIRRRLGFVDLASCILTRCQ